MNRWLKVTRQEEGSNERVSRQQRRLVASCGFPFPSYSPNEFVQGSFETLFVPNDFSCLLFLRDNEFPLIRSSSSYRDSRISSIEGSIRPSSVNDRANNFSNWTTVYRERGGRLFGLIRKEVASFGSALFSREMKRTRLTNCCSHS